MASLSVPYTGAPASGSNGSGALAHFYPLYLLEPYPVSKAFWCNGATVGTDQIDIGIYRCTDQTTGRMDLVRSTGAVYSNFPNVVQEAGWAQVTAVNHIAGGTATGATTFATVPVRMAADKMYLLTVENVHGASASPISSVDNGPTFTSRSTTQYNGTLNRTSVWSAAPTVNYSGTLVINFGAGGVQTGCTWTLEELSGVDTATNDGVVQQVVATGSSGTAAVALSAFASIYNATFFGQSHASSASTTAKAQFPLLLMGQIVGPPAMGIGTEWFVGNDTAPSMTFTSAAWGACGLEIKAAAAHATPWSIARTLLLNSSSTADATSYATASVTLKAGRLYLLCVGNSKAASADVVSGVTGGPTFTSRASGYYGGTTTARLSVWSSAPSTDYTGTLTISFGGTQTNCSWVLVECSGVDTSVSDGVVQVVANSGSDTNPKVDLAAFGSASNATFFCASNNNDQTTTPAPGFTELSDWDGVGVINMETQWRVDNHRNPSGTISSGAWAAIALEIKCDTSPLVIPPSTPGNPNVYMAISASGTAATFLRQQPFASTLVMGGILSLASTFPLPSVAMAGANGANATRRHLAGFSLRSLIG
jgi:hypothetical protein